MISIAGITFDMSGYITLEPLGGSDYGLLARRFKKSQTLDGGVSVSDFGYTSADREFDISLQPTSAQDSTLRYLVENHDQVHVSTEEGFYKAVPQYTIRGGIASLTLSITEQIA
jgi:hypothetical protein